MNEFPLTLDGPWVRAILDGRMTSIDLHEDIVRDDGDFLWVRETWAINQLHDQPGHAKFAYAADGHSLARARGGRWLAPEIMPRRASRLTLQVTSREQIDGGLWHYEFRVFSRKVA